MIADCAGNFMHLIPTVFGIRLLSDFFRIEPIAALFKLDVRARLVQSRTGTR